jgi:ribosomal protein L37AE/L43A
MGAKGWSWASGMAGKGLGSPDPSQFTFNATHDYDPVGWDVFDPKTHPGTDNRDPIPAGSQVMCHGKMDPSGILQHVSDADGRHQTVMKNSISPLKKKTAAKGTCSYCGEPSEHLNSSSQGGLCDDCNSEVGDNSSLWDENGKRKAGDGHPDWKPYESSRKRGAKQEGIDDLLDPDDKDCDKCGGTGQVNSKDESQMWTDDCPKCGGTGRLYWHSGSRKQATVHHVRADQLNPGDQFVDEAGRTHVMEMGRKHETARDPDPNWYLHTNQGTTLVRRNQMFDVSPTNNRQQSLPSYGTPGGNSNVLPFNPQSSPGAKNVAPGETGQAGGGHGTQCPSCKASGTLTRKGNHYVCSRCGYQETFGGGGGAGNAFSDAPRRVRGSRYSTINSAGMSAIARRARAVLAQEENS